MLNRRQGLQAAAALTGLALAGRAKAAPPATVVPLSEQRNHFMVDVAINGVPGFSFVLDTGASAHFLSTRVVDQLGLRQIDERNVRGFTGMNRDKVFSVRGLNVGGVELGPTRAIAWAPDRMDNHDGLIGYPFLFPRALIALSEGRLSLGGEAPASPLIPVQARVARNQTLLLGGLPGADGRFVMDTGSQLCTIGPDYAARIADSEAYQAAPKLTYRTAEGESRIGAFRPALMAFGAFEIVEPVIRIGSASGENGVFHQVDGLFGVNLLKPYRWLLDQPRAQLQVVGPTPARLEGGYGAGFRIERSGGVARIAGVQGGGPAHEAGLRAGQVVLALDGEPQERWRRGAALALEDGPRTQWIELIERGVRRSVTLETRRLL